jgi:streptogramin lyase
MIGCRFGRTLFIRWARDDSTEWARSSAGVNGRSARRPPRTPIIRATRQRPLFWRLAVVTSALLGVPVLALSVTAGMAAASGAGQNTMYRGISEPWGVAAGSDGVVWFTSLGNDSIGRVTSAVVAASELAAPSG